MTNIKTKTVTLDENPEQRIDSFIDLCKVDGAHAAKSISHSIRKKGKWENKRDRLTVKMKRRKEILQEQRRRFEAKRQELRKAEERMLKSQESYTGLSAELRMANSHIEDLEYSNSHHQQRLYALNNTFGDELSMASRVAMLSFIEDYIDTRVPIKYELEERANNEYVQRLVWVTKKNSVSWESFNGHHISSTEFGPFIVCVSRTVYTNGNSGIDVSVRMFDENIPYADNPAYSAFISTRPNQCDDWTQTARPFAVSDGYVHPHISTGLEVCTGDSKSDIMSCMADSDYTRVIQTVMLVLTHYNEGDPYRRLDYYERLPQPETVYTCTSCNQTLLSCECVRSTVTGEVVEEEFLSPCGCTYSECLSNHERHNTTSGINGTGCFPVRHSQRYVVSEADAQSHGFPEQLQDFETAIAEVGAQTSDQEGSNLRAWVENIID